jgi:snoRNA binding domain, fibrillarin
VGAVVLLADGPRLALVPLATGARVTVFPLAPVPAASAHRFLALADGDLPAPVCDAARELPAGTEVTVADPRWRDPLARGAGRPVREATLPELRRARDEADRQRPREDRAFLLAVAREALEQALSSPEEVLVSLAREEERLERALGREGRAADAFVAVPGTLLEEYRPLWDESRAALLRHHEQLVSLLGRAARTVVPNLSTVVGERVAGRLVAASGGLRALGRVSASRLQLLGSRRRPSPERGPRYGVIYRAVRMNDVPAARRGDYARSLAALAVIAARADATTHGSVAPLLVTRRDRRVESLRRRR